MGDLGLPGAYGAAGAAAALRQLIADRIAAKVYADQQAQQQFQNQIALRNADRADRQLDESSRLRQQQQDDLLEERRRQDADRLFRENSTLNESIPPKTFIKPDSPIVGRLMPIGALQKQESRPRVDVGPLQEGDTGEARDEGFIKLPSAKQLDTEADNKRQADQVARERERDAETKRHNTAMEGREQPGHFSQLPQYDDKGNPLAPMAFDSRTGTARAIPGAGASRPTPGAAQAAQHEAAKKEALGSLDQLDAAINEAAAFIGPGAGRVSGIQQMIGSQDPKLQALGTKMLLAKMQVDHAATGTVRAGASPMLLQRWDNILSQNVTPEGLKAAVQAMREILGGQAGTTTGPTPPKRIRYDLNGNPIP